MRSNGNGLRAFCLYDNEIGRAVWPRFHKLRRFRLGLCCECSGSLNLIQSGSSTRFSPFEGEVRAGSRSFIVGAHPHGIFPFTAVCAAAWAPLAEDMRASAAKQHLESRLRRRMRWMALVRHWQGHLELSVLDGFQVF